MIGWNALTEGNRTPDEFGVRLHDEWSESDSSDDEAALLPRADLFDDGDSLTIDVELPGICAQDISIHVSGDDIVVEATRGFVRNGRDIRRLESRYGRLRRRFMLPMRAQPDHAEATLRLGFLRIVVPRSPVTATATRMIEPAGEDAPVPVNVN